LLYGKIAGLRLLHGIPPQFYPLSHQSYQKTKKSNILAKKCKQFAGGVSKKYSELCRICVAPFLNQATPWATWGRKTTGY